MLIAIASGLGIGVLPCFMGDAESDLVRFEQAAGDDTRLSLVYRREARIARPIRLVELVMTSLQQQAVRLLGR